MSDPLYLLLAGIVVMAILAALFWPKTGLVERRRAMQRTTERVHIEDALKHLYDCEYQGLTCTLMSLAGAVDMSLDGAARLVGQVESMGLLRSESGVLHLSDAGRATALRIVRTHRLWEKYLAEESGYKETEWHKEAERREHMMSQADTDALAARIGNPGFDPHGDPIPTARGEIPESKGIPLTDLPPGSLARVVHLEDEPATIYAQLVAQGLYPGAQIRMISRDPGRIAFTADEQECVLAPVLGRNVTVATLEQEERLMGPYRTLASVPVGETVSVVGISRSCRGAQRRRLMDFGVVKGSTIRPELVSAGGDPVGYRVRGSLIALRKRQAEQVYVTSGENRS